MPHPSQRTLYLTLNQSADIAGQADNLSSLAVAKGSTFVSAGFSTTSSNTFLYLVQNGQTSTTGVSVPRSAYAFENGVYIKMKAPLLEASTVYYGGCISADFVVPFQGTVTITNNNAATIYFKAGTANASGLTIAKPGDANGNNIQGTPIYAYGQWTSEPNEFPPGTEVYLLGTASSQTVTVMFNPML